MKNTFRLSIKFARYDGIVARLALLTERRGFAIENLSIIQTSDDFFTMYLHLSGEAARFNQVCQQILKLIDVIDLKLIEEKEPDAVVSGQ